MGKNAQPGGRLSLDQQPKLKPCPFCGSINAPSVYSNGIGDFYVACDDGYDDEGCEARTSDRNCEGVQLAADRWNHRKS